MITIVQDFKNWRNAKKIADAAKSGFNMHTQQNFEHCHAYPCFYDICCDSKKIVQMYQSKMIYESFCKDCSAFNILTKLYESQKAKQKLLNNFMFWKQRTK